VKAEARSLVDGLRQRNEAAERNGGASVSEVQYMQMENELVERLSRRAA